MSPNHVSAMIAFRRREPLSTNENDMMMKAKDLAWLTGHTLICALLLTSAAGCATRTAVVNGRGPSAQVAGLKGAARYTTGSLPWQELKAGDLLEPGCIVETASESCLDLVLSAEGLPTQPKAGPTALRVWENSRLVIDELFRVEAGPNAVMATQVDLQAGRISGKARGLSAASRFEVKIPNAVARIHGAVYDICAEGEVKARAGSVSLEYTDPSGKRTKEVIVGSQAPGSAISPNSDSKPSRKALLSRSF